MGSQMGYSGLAVLYGYFLASGAVVRRVSPPFPRLIAEQAQLEGEFRHAHVRLIAHSEEVAFLEGAAREEAILDAKLTAVTRFAGRCNLLQLRQGVTDQFLLKYFASCVGWRVPSGRRPPAASRPACSSLDAARACLSRANLFYCALSAYINCINNMQTTI